MENENQSNADVYAEFGGSIGDAVVSDGELSEHDRAMLELDVQVRDGDDSIDINSNDEDTDETESQEDEEYEDADESEDEQVDTKEEGVSLDTASTDLKEGQEGLQSMVELAVKNGLPETEVQNIMKEYTDNQELSEESLQKLEESGFSRKFVKNYIAGQQAIVDRMAQGLVNFVGGADQWNNITTYLGSNDPDTLDSLQEALDSNNIKMVKTILTLTQKTINSNKTEKFGKKQERSISRSAKPVIQANIENKVQGFKSQSEMVAAMNDRRYSNDPQYRSMVEQRIGRSNF